MSMTLKSQSLSRSRSHVGGFTLVELMIAMLLGLIVVGSALAIFTTNKRTYVTTENLGRVQENGRVAYELMSREVREAGGLPCSKKLPVANVLTTAGTYWWSNWSNPIKGYGNSGLPADDLLNPAINIGLGVADRVMGTDAIELKSVFDSGVTVVSNAPTTITLTTANHGLATADIVLVCDYTQAAIFQVTSVLGADIGHAKALSNCSQNLGLPVICPAAGTAHSYGSNSTIAKLHATRWYIGYNARGGTSLYQSSLSGGAPLTQEVTEGVSGMSLQYLMDGDFKYRVASLITDWSAVVGVRINLTLLGRDKVGTNGLVLSRSLSHSVNLRNRTP